MTRGSTISRRGLCQEVFRKRGDIEFCLVPAFVLWHVLQTPVKDGIEFRPISFFFLWHVFHHLIYGVRLSRGFFRMTPRDGGDRILSVSSFCSMACFARGDFTLQRK